MPKIQGWEKLSSDYRTFKDNWRGTFSGKTVYVKIYTAIGKHFMVVYDTRGNELDRQMFDTQKQAVDAAIKFMKQNKFKSEF
ncbi:MAG: hypothetical protein ACOC2M_05045 [bacterium]